MAIPYTVTKSAAFFILSTFLLFIGEFCCLCGHYSRQRRLLTFISGVVFIISGLLMLIGLVMYISIFKAEVGGKLRPISLLQPAVFTYKYGYSFILYVTGFVSTEISGTCAVFLYIYWHQKDWRKKNNDLRTKFVSPNAVLNVNSMENLHSFCRRHPYNFSGNGAECSPSQEITENFMPTLQRRFYLDNQSDNNSENGFASPVCIKHSISCSIFDDCDSDFVPKKQSRKVGTDEMKENCSSFPLHLCNHHFILTHACESIIQNYMPDGPSTKSVNDLENEEDTLDCSSSSLHDHDFVPFDLDENSTPVPLMSDYSDLEDCIRREKYVYDTLSKTTPV